MEENLCTFSTGDIIEVALIEAVIQKNFLFLWFLYKWMDEETIGT